MVVARAFFLGGGSDDGSWGAIVILALLFAPCVVGGGLRLWDRLRARQSQDAV